MLWLLRCRVGSLTKKYLGTPLGTPYKIASVWNPILDRMGKKLSSWKCLYLLKGGRRVLFQVFLHTTYPYLPSL